MGAVVGILSDRGFDQIAFGNEQKVIQLSLPGKTIDIFAGIRHQCFQLRKFLFVKVQIRVAVRKVSNRWCFVIRWNSGNGISRDCRVVDGCRCLRCGSSSRLCGLNHRQIRTAGFHKGDIIDIKCQIFAGADIQTNCSRIGIVRNGDIHGKLRPSVRRFDTDALGFQVACGVLPHNKCSVA